MSVKVELHPDVHWFLKWRCTLEERKEFRQRLQEVEAEPIKHSDSIIVPELSR